MAKIRTPHVRGARALVAMLPNGSSVWLNLRPAPVTVREFDHLAESIDRADARHTRVFNSNARAAKQLAGFVKRDTAKVRRMRLLEDRKLRHRISDGDAKLHRRIIKSLTPAKGQSRKDHKKRMALLRSTGRRDLWNQLVLVSAALLMSAYGQRSDPLAENNLVIGIALGVWLFGDEVSDLLSGKRTIETGPIRSSDTWSYIAPFANLLTCWWLLNGRQHERFITGTVELKDFSPLPYESTSDYPALENSSQQDRFLYARVDLSSRIAPEHYSDFQGFENVPALATIQSVEPDVTGNCPQVSLHEVAVMLLRDDLNLNLIKSLVIIVKVPSRLLALKQLQVAWVVDTQKPPQDSSS